MVQMLTIHWTNHLLSILSCLRLLQLHVFAIASTESGMTLNLLNSYWLREIGYCYWLLFVEVDKNSLNTSTINFLICNKNVCECKLANKVLNATFSILRLKQSYLTSTLRKTAFCVYLYDSSICFINMK